MRVEFHKTTSDMIILYSRQRTTDALLFGALLASACLALFTKIALRRVQTLKKAVNFV
jgi:hypothetical protein